jgi:hypothetical protein
LRLECSPSLPSPSASPYHVAVAGRHSMSTPALAAAADLPPPNSNAAEMGSAGSRAQRRKRARAREEAIAGGFRGLGRLWLLAPSRPPLLLLLPLAGLVLTGMEWWYCGCSRRRSSRVVGFFLGLALLWLREIPSPNAQSEQSEALSAGWPGLWCLLHLRSCSVVCTNGKMGRFYSGKAVGERNTAIRNAVCGMVHVQVTGV